MNIFNFLENFIFAVYNLELMQYILALSLICIAFKLFYCLIGIWKND